MKMPSNPDWLEYVIMFTFLTGAVVVLGFVGALLMELIFTLL